MFDNCFRKEWLHSNLWPKWPDGTVLAVYDALFSEFESCYRSRARLLPAEREADRAFQAVCHRLPSLIPSLADLTHGERDVNPGRQPVIGTTCPRHDGVRFLQVLASALGMLMHLRTPNGGSRMDESRRRPRKRYTTYPNSPSLSRIVADYVLGKMVSRMLPRECRSAREADSCMRRALDFRLLDPSMESGQFLLQIAASLVTHIKKHSDGSGPSELRLVRAALQRLCEHVLWGVDRNPRAIHAVNALFEVLCTHLGVPKMRPRNLLVANSIESLAHGRLSGFDAVVNNPPWGERLGAADRKLIRELRAATHISDTYVAFTELGVASLRPGGVFALVLPSQFLGARNAAGLRELLLQSTVVDRLVVLPRHTFADAGVRGAVILGRKAGAGTRRARIAVTRYPPTPTLAEVGEAESFAVSFRDLARLGRRAWTPVVNRNGWRWQSQGFPALGDVARTATGVKLYGVGKGHPAQTEEARERRSFDSDRPLPGMVPAVRGRDVRDFTVRRASKYVRLGPWLADMGRHDRWLSSQRVFVRELCRRDGKLNAGLAPKGVVPLHGVLTVLPIRIDACVLIGILNSRLVAEYLRETACAFWKNDFQRVTLRELERLPVPAAAIRPPGPGQPRRHTPSFEKLMIAELREVSRILSVGTDMPERGPSARDRVEELVAELYGVEADA